MDGTPDRSNTILATGRLPRRLATRRLRRIGLRISGKIDAQSKPPPSGRGHSFQARAKAPRAPQNNLGSHIRDPDHPLVCTMGPISLPPAPVTDDRLDACFLAAHFGKLRRWSQRGSDQRTIVSGMDSKSEIRELTTSELETVSGGMVTLDFGIVAIYLQFASVDTGPMTGARSAAITATVSVRFFGP